MTNYNDGKWHGWNGGECPVHPKSRVHVRLLDPDRETPNVMVDRADTWSWAHSGRSEIIAFRVIKEYREPRRCWSYGAHIRDTEAEVVAFRTDVAKANPGCGYENHPITEWVEVLK